MLLLGVRGIRHNLFLEKMVWPIAPTPRPLPSRQWYSPNRLSSGPVPGAVLVLGELHDVAGDLAQLQVGIAIVPEVLQQPAAAGGHDVGHAVA